MKSFSHIDVICLTAISILFRCRLVHSWVLDMSCPLVKTWFFEQEWQEICSTNPKEDPEIDKLTENLILRYDVKTCHELRAAVMKPWLQEEYERQKHFDVESL